MKFSDLAARFKDVGQCNTLQRSECAISELHEKYLWDVSGAETNGWGEVGSGQPFNAFLSWNSSF